LQPFSLEPFVFCLYKNIKIIIYKTIILPVVLNGCETWSLKLGEEYRLRVFENGVLRRIFGPKRDEVTGGWGKLHNEELHNLVFFAKYNSNDQWRAFVNTVMNLRVP
jgi:hypothetical protein